MDSRGSRDLRADGVEIENLIVRPLTREETAEQHAQLRRAWWMKLLFRRHYTKMDLQ